MTIKEQLIEMFSNRQAKVAVIGLGYVGLPLAVEAAKAGYQVIGIEVDSNKVNLVNQGKNYIGDVKDEELNQLVSNGKLRATLDYSEIQNVEVVAITVPTPLNKTGDPDMQFIVSALDKMEPFVHQGMLVTLESTTYPGTTNELMVPQLTRNGLKIGVDIFASFSPERVDPGNPIYHTQNTPKVVGGSTSDCCEVAISFYQTVIQNVVRVSSATAAEMVKLYENTFRAINIGLVNELAIICDVLGTDVWEIVNAAATKPFGFMPFYPGPGLGGHCIPIDPSYLAWKLRFHNYRAKFIELATEINGHMPEYVIQRIIRIFNNLQRSVKGSKILLMGMAYKADIDDVRESPALDVMILLKKLGATVDYYDPHVPSIREENHSIQSIALTSDKLNEYDLVVITTDHKKVDYQLVIDHSKLIFDTRNALQKLGYKGNNVIKL
ncbi:MAG: nucleotide sugar dehydrogenase [bacterium]|nr:nucleotide sugar dehydrogenase [bacterium]